VAAIDTSLPPPELLSELLAIEVRHGRERAAARRNGPRTLDLDLLWYGGLAIDLPQLTLPHPRMAERPFVLLPLADIAPDLEIPGLGAVRSLLRPEFASLCWPLAHSSPALPPSG
jgi:2-amino-4-hydroxy-6-hydroxymethyldihydropteridine diphosphokinase